MRQRIEIISLSPNYDIKTNSLTAGLVLSYKKNTGMIESMQLEGSQKSIMDMFKIENLTDIAGKKVDLDFEEKDGKQKMSGISIVDERVPSFSDYERLENKLNQIINLLKK